MHVAQPQPRLARDARGPAKDFIIKLVIGRLFRPDAADLVAVGRPDVAGLREEAAVIPLQPGGDGRRPRPGPDHPAADARRNRPASTRLAEITDELDHAARENVLTPLVAAENAAAVWADLDLSRQRAVLKTLMTITLLSPGMGARRAFDAATVQVTWRHQDGGEASPTTTR